MTAVDTFMRLAAVKAATGLGRSTIYDEMAKNPPQFPRPIKINGGRAVAWSAAEVAKWQQERMGKRGPATKGEFTGQSGVLSTRMTPACRREIEKAAKKSGRSLGQEVEFLIWRGLRSSEPTEREIAAYLRSLADELDRKIP